MPAERAGEGAAAGNGNGNGIGNGAIDSAVVNGALGEAVRKVNRAPPPQARDETLHHANGDGGGASDDRQAAGHAAPPPQSRSGAVHDNGGGETVVAADPLEQQPSSSEPTLLAVSPPGCGLLLTLEDDPSAPGGPTHSLTLRFVNDASLPHVHPHVRCPSTIPPSTSRLLHGGGSGVAVFSGRDEILGSVVMKHGNHKDVDEVVALATVARELTLRGRLGPDASEAAKDLATRIPDFRSIYISPDHLRDRGRDLWVALRKALHRWGWRGLKGRAANDDAATSTGLAESLPSNHNAALLTASASWAGSESSDGGESVGLSSRGSSGFSIGGLGPDSGGGSGSSGGLVMDGSERGGGSMRSVRGSLRSASSRTSILNKNYAEADRNIRIFAGRRADGGESSVVVTRNHFDIYLDSSKDIACTTESNWGVSSPVVRLSGPPNASGYAALKRLAIDLHHALRRKVWKATLAQSTIGGPDARTASSLHLDGTLRQNGGRLLDVLIDEFVKVVRGLQSLTLPEEEEALEAVRVEIVQIEQRLADEQQHDDMMYGSDVSRLADAFVGRAIRKNFHPTVGRFAKLRKTGGKFRAGTMMLTSEERLPAEALGRMLDPDTVMGDLFVVLPPSSSLSSGGTGTAQQQQQHVHHRRLNKDGALTSFWDGVYDGSPDGRAWLRLLKHAASLRGKACTSRVWNGGLADAGLHNQFLDDGKLFLFDLGKPTCEPIPAFLTKFFMSFFHTPGMEEREDGGGWVRRFKVVEEGDDGRQHRLALTAATTALLPRVQASFERTLDRLIDELFDGETAVRALVIKYVILQLTSDAAFCLERWDIKGGGKDRAGNHHSDLESWLWRALWDLYVAWHVGSTMLSAEDWKCGS